jgi:hypothetical protein
MVLVPDACPHIGDWRGRNDRINYLLNAVPNDNINNVLDAGAHGLLPWKQARNHWVLFCVVRSRQSWDGSLNILVPRITTPPSDRILLLVDVVGIPTPLRNSHLPFLMPCPSLGGIRCPNTNCR